MEFGVQCSTCSVVETVLETDRRLMRGAQVGGQEEARRLQGETGTRQAAAQAAARDEGRHPRDPQGHGLPRPPEAQRADPTVRFGPAVVFFFLSFSFVRANQTVLNPFH